MYRMNVFRVLGDLSHALSKGILITSILRNRSSEGVSLLTQALYALVFCTRYLDLLWTNPLWSLWNTTLKLLYISTSFFIIFLMMNVYARTRETEAAWKFATLSLASSAIAAPIIPPLLAFVFRDENKWDGLFGMIHDFSEILESVCILPQLLLLRQTTVPTVIDSFYLAALFAYRIFYVFNWILREADPNDHVKPDRVDVMFGVIQVILYCDFAWVYYTRQRVKLRGGGLVDSDDLRRGLFMRRLMGKPAAESQDDEEGAAALGAQDYNDHTRSQATRPAGQNKWGARGISVSADDSVLAQEQERQGAGHSQDRFLDEEATATDARMTDPDDLALDLDDDESEAEDTSSSKLSIAKDAGVTGGEEWRG